MMTNAQKIDQLILNISYTHDTSDVQDICLNFNKYKFVENT